MPRSKEDYYNALKGTSERIKVLPGNKFIAKSKHLQYLMGTALCKDSNQTEDIESDLQT